MKLKPADPVTLYPQFYITGLWLGYPECCALSFRIRHDGRSYPDDKPFPLIGTGFVPCLKCAETKTADQLRAEINSQRMCPRPFPEEDADAAPPLTRQFAIEVLQFRKLIPM